MSDVGKSVFTSQPIRRIFKKAGAVRVADSAVEELRKALEEKSVVLISEASKIAKHANRATIFPEDIKLAKKVVERI
jgi:histone H3/H4